jgi:hypothetical protein
VDVMERRGMVFYLASYFALQLHSRVLVNKVEVLEYLYTLLIIR